MNLILLSGGSGQRLWPLSNNSRSKQFIKFLSYKKNRISMLQNVFSKLDKNIGVTITTSKSQVSAIRNQLGSNLSICVEPVRKDTFPAIVLACSFLYNEQNVGLDEPIIVCPVDPYVGKSFFKALEKLGQLVAESNYNLSLLGIKPTYPSEKYGYIIPESFDKISAVSMFKEKPNEVLAKEYINKGALWNGGVFGFKLGYILNKAHEIIDFKDYEDLYRNYNKVKKISFDYAIVEREKKIQVMQYSGDWKDLGTWNTLTESMGEHIVGKGIVDDQCENVHILNELDIPILGMGLKNMIIAASPQGILVSDKDRSAHIKPYVEQMKQEVMFAEKSWGKYKVLNVENMSQTILITLRSKQRMSYHSHDYRDEVWTIVSGNGIAVVDGIPRPVKVGDVIEIPRGTKHTLVADLPLTAVETQMGKDISVKDKHKYEFNDDIVK